MEVRLAPMSVKNTVPRRRVMISGRPSAKYVVLTQRAVQKALPQVWGGGAGSRAASATCTPTGSSSGGAGKTSASSVSSTVFLLIEGPSDRSCHTSPDVTVLTRRKTRARAGVHSEGNRGAPSGVQGFDDGCGGRDGLGRAGPLFGGKVAGRRARPGRELPTGRRARLRAPGRAARRDGAGPGHPPARR